MKSILAIGCVALLGLAIAIQLPAGCARMLYNPTDSAPRGWYWLQPGAALSIGDEVLVDLPPTAATLAAKRRYLPAGVPLLKRIGALGGQQICVRDHVVFIDGAPTAPVLSHDTTGRPLPLWAPCRSLREGELFLLNATRAASFDSRYFGPIAAARVRGRAIPLWTWESP